MRPFPRNTNSESKLLLGSLVEYQQHGTPHLGIIVAEKRNKFVVRNAHDATLELGADRLVLLEQKQFTQVDDVNAITKFLSSLEARVDSGSKELDLAEAWELLFEDGKAVPANKIIDLLVSDSSCENQITARRALIEDRIYFKRQKKSELFEPRTPALVEELQHQARIELEKQKHRDSWIEKALLRLSDETAELPPQIEILEQLAAQGRGAPKSAEAQLLVDTLVERTNITSAKSQTQRTIDVLVALKHFSPHELLTPYRLQRPLRFSSDDMDEIEKALANQKKLHQPQGSLKTITIDGPETKDFDDALSFTRIDDNSVKIGIHISDVSSVITPGSPLHSCALRRATSVYCPDKYYPMLPRELSEQALSLRESALRPVVSCYLVVSSEFEILSKSFALETITVDKRATYSEVDTLLCDGLAELAEYEEMLRFCWEFSSNSELQRIEQGAAQFVRRELSPSIDSDYQVTLSSSDEDTPSRKLVSELMVICNHASAQFAHENNLSLAFRAQEAPEVDYLSQGEHIPEGPARDFFQRSFFKRSLLQSEADSHFGLGVDMYTQVTSPIRRAIDLINQQQITHFISQGSALYSKEEIDSYLVQIQKGLDEAFQIQRESNRYWLLQYLRQEKIKTVQGTVMRTDGPRPLVEIDTSHSIFSFHAAKNAHIAPGDRINLEIQSINPKKDSIVLRQLS